MPQGNPYGRHLAPANPYGNYVPIGDPDPTYSYKGPKAQADLQNTNSEIADRAAARRDEHTRLLIELHGKGLTVDPTGKVVPLTQSQNQQPLTPAMQARVNQLLDGRSILTAREKGMPYGQQLMDAANAQDPMFDEAASKARWAARQQFTGEGKGAQVVASSERLAQHANDLYSASAALDGPNLGFTPLSNLAANVGQSMQGPAVARYNGILPLIAGELQKLTKNGSATKDESDRIMSNLASGQSSAARTAAIQDVIKLAEAQKQPLHDQWESAWSGTTAPKMPMDFNADTLALNDNIMSGGKPIDTDSNGHIVGGASATNGSGPPSGTGGIGPSGNSSPPMPGFGGPTGTLATGDTKESRDTGRETAISAMMRKMVASGQIDPQAISDANVKMGGQPISADDVSRMTALVKGGYGGSLIDSSVPVPTTGWNRFAASPTGTGIYAGVDAALGGTTDEPANLLGGGNLADLNARKQAAFASNPNASLVGQTLGTIGGMAALGGAGRATGLVSKFILPEMAGDIGFGAFSGAGQNNDNRLLGATAGAFGGLGGNLLGQGVSRVIGAAARTAPGLAATNGLRMFAGRAPIAGAASLSPAERATLSAVNRAGPDQVTGALTDAQNLNVPMSLADTDPNLRELAGAAVRRSPTASSFAEDNLLPRSRGQYERLANAVDQHLGPTSNIPQMSADLTARAKTAAAPLYDAAYAAPGASSVNLSDLAQRPSMQAGLSRAYGIAKEEGRDPTSLGFDLDNQGNVTLNRVPSFQTMDYVKRGLDDTLEQYRNPMTNKLALNESTRAINATKNEFLGRVDAVNPNYAAARAAFAGPSQAKDALGAGYDAFSANPNQLGVDVAGATPERMAQMQVGYRGGLMDAADRLRYSSNPFDGTLGTPAAEQRLSTLYPNTPGVADLLRTRDMEGGMQQTTNAILGNSRTARNLIADQSFAPSPLVDGAVHAGAAMVTHGASLPATASRFMGTGLSDAFNFGANFRAIAKADDLAPLLMTPDPTASLATVGDLLGRDGSYNAFVQATRPKGLGMFGSAFGSQAAASAPNYWQR